MAKKKESCLGTIVRTALAVVLFVYAMRAAHNVVEVIREHGLMVRK